MISKGVGNRLTSLVSKGSERSNAFRATHSILIASSRPLIVICPNGSTACASGGVAMTLPGGRIREGRGSSTSLKGCTLNCTAAALRTGRASGMDFTLRRGATFMGIALSADTCDDLGLSNIGLCSGKTGLSKAISYSIAANTLSIAGTSSRINMSCEAPIIFSGTRALCFAALPYSLAKRSACLVIAVVSRAGGDAMAVPTGMAKNGLVSLVRVSRPAEPEPV